MWVPNRSKPFIKTQKAKRSMKVPRQKQVPPLKANKSKNQHRGRWQQALAQVLSRVIEELARKEASVCFDSVEIYSKMRWWAVGVFKECVRDDQMRYLDCNFEADVCFCIIFCHMNLDVGRKIVLLMRPNCFAVANKPWKPLRRIYTLLRFITYMICKRIVKWHMPQIPIHQLVYQGKD